MFESEMSVNAWDFKKKKKNRNKNIKINLK